MVSKQFNAKILWTPPTTPELLLHARHELKKFWLYGHKIFPALVLCNFNCPFKCAFHWVDNRQNCSFSIIKIENDFKRSLKEKLFCFKTSLSSNLGKTFPKLKIQSSFAPSRFQLRNKPKGECDMWKNEWRRGTRRGHPQCDSHQRQLAGNVKFVGQVHRASQKESENSAPRHSRRVPGADQTSIRFMGFGDSKCLPTLSTTRSQRSYRAWPTPSA